MSEEWTDTPQRPIDSGFGHGSTAMEVIDGIDLTGKRAIVTGGYSGLGLETVRALVAAGGEVTVPARRLDHARTVLADAGLANAVQVEHLDLADQDSVKEFSARYVAEHGAVRLDRLGRESGVRVFAVHPGGIMTELQRHLPKEEMVAAGWMDAQGKLREGFKTTEQGAATSVWAATSKALVSEGGVYCEDCDIAEPTDKNSPMARYQGVDAHAIDKSEARKLWEVSAEMTGVNAFA